MQKLCDCCKQNPAVRRFTIREDYDCPLEDLNGEIGYITLKRKIHMCKRCHEKFVDYMTWEIFKDD